MNVSGKLKSAACTPYSNLETLHKHSSIFDLNPVTGNAYPWFPYLQSL